MKQQLLEEINRKLKVLGVFAQNGNGADITINTELLDASWSSGSKKINYEASVFANDQENVIYMYEKTTEIGHGLSFGGSSSSSFQSGKTLYRKVKSQQYGIDGKSYEYTFDLGAIPKAVKETAKQYGWKFKTVINKNKAIYPVGYTPTFVAQQTQTQQTQTQQIQTQQIQTQPVSQAPPVINGFCSNCGMQRIETSKFCTNCGNPVDVTPQQLPSTPSIVSPQYNNPQGKFYSETKQKSGRKGGTLGFIGFILLGIVFVAMLAAVKATLTGWVLSFVIYTIALVAQRKLSRKGCLLNLILWLFTGFVLFVVMSISITDTESTAKLKNEHMTTAMDSNGKPIDEASESQTTSEEMPEEAAKAPFRIDYLSYGIWPSFTYESDASYEMNLSAIGVMTFSLNANSTVFSDVNDKVAKITATFHLIDPPSFGTVKLYRQRPDLATAPTYPKDREIYILPMTFDLAITDNFEDSEKPENYNLSFVNFLNYGQIRIYYSIENLMPIDSSLSSWMDSIPIALEKGLTSDALRSKVGIELFITMDSGEKHQIYFEREMMPGDFFSSVRLNDIIEDYQGKETTIFSKKAE